jgi:hypothetical protein
MGWLRLAREQSYSQIHYTGAVVGFIVGVVVNIALTVALPVGLAAYLFTQVFVICVLIGHFLANRERFANKMGGFGAALGIVLFFIIFILLWQSGINPGFFGSSQEYPLVEHTSLYSAYF